MHMYTLCVCTYVCYYMSTLFLLLVCYMFTWFPMCVMCRSFWPYQSVHQYMYHCCGLGGVWGGAILIRPHPLLPGGCGHAHGDDVWSTSQCSSIWCRIHQISSAVLLSNTSACCQKGNEHSISSGSLLLSWFGQKCLAHNMLHIQYGYMIEPQLTPLAANSHTLSHGPIYGC